MWVLVSHSDCFAHRKTAPRDPVWSFWRIDFLVLPARSIVAVPTTPLLLPQHQMRENGTFQLTCEHSISRYLSLTWCGHLASYHYCARNCCLYLHGRNSVIQNCTFTAVKFCLACGSRSSSYVEPLLYLKWHFWALFNVDDSELHAVWGCAKLIVAHLPKDNFHFTWRFTTIFNRARLWSISNLSQTISLHGSL